MRRSSVLPGFRLSMGVTLSYLCVIVVAPLVALLAQTARIDWGRIAHELTSPRVVASFELSVGAALIAAALNGVFGLLVAWVLARYRFPGHGLMNALVDLPFALPTAVAGIALTAIYATQGWMGRWLEPLGIKVAFTRLGVIVAMTFVGLPLVVRTIQPIIEDFDRATEEAGATLGGSRLQIFLRLLLPPILPPLATGCTLAFARALGEYGSVIFISGNMPMRTEIVPLLIVTKLEQYDYPGAMAIALVLLLLSLCVLLVSNVLQGSMRRRLDGVSSS